MKRVKGIEDLNICIIGAQGIVGVGPSPACAHDRTGWWHLTRRPALAVLPARILPPRARALPPLPPAVPQGALRSPRGRPPQLLRRPHRSRRCAILRSLSGAAAQGRVGRLLKAAVRRA